MAISGPRLDTLQPSSSATAARRGPASLVNTNMCFPVQTAWFRWCLASKFTGLHAALFLCIIYCRTMRSISSKNRLKTATAFRQTAPKEFRNLLLLNLSGFEIC